MAAETAVSKNVKMHITKTETEYNMKSIRFLLLTITAMFIVIAGLMIVLGNSVYSHYHSFSFFYDSAKPGKFMTPSALCVFIGLAFMLVSIFGFFGSLKQSTCMVNVYALILILVFIIQLVIVIVAFTMDTGTLMHYINVPVKGYATDPEIQAEVDYIQNTLGCCGSDSYMDYTGMNFNNHSTVVISKVVDGNLVSMVLPDTCCVTREEFCTRMWSLGCKEALVNALVQNSIIIGVLGVSVMFITVLGITFALLLARCIRKVKSERALLTWKAKEKIIMALQAEEIHKNEQNQVYIDPQASSMA